MMSVPLFVSASSAFAVSHARVATSRCMHCRGVSAGRQRTSASAVAAGRRTMSTMDGRTGYSLCQFSLRMHILEHGTIAIVARPRVRREEIETLDDVQRMLWVLAPAGGGARHIVV